MKLYNEFLNEINIIKNDDYVPTEIKKCLSIIEEKIKHFNKSFSLFLDFSKERYFNISFNLNVKFEKSIIIDYSAYINYGEVKKNDFQNFDINVHINDEEINLEFLLSCISHELYHVYELILLDNEYEISSFKKSPLINKYLFSPFALSEGSSFRKFVILVYESLTHEVNAKIKMIYFLNKYKGTYDKTQLIEFFKKSSIYKSIKNLSEFNSKDFVDSFDFDDLLLYTNDFISNHKENKKCSNIDDLYDFYYNWEKIFKNTSKFILEQSENIIDELIKDIKPYMEKYNFCCTIKNYYTIQEHLQQIFSKI